VPGMGESTNFQAQYLDSMLTHVTLVAFLVVFAAVGLWWWMALKRDRGVLAVPRRRFWQVFEAGSPARTVIQVGFGALWVIDGLLQAQPAMPREFVPMVLEPALAGQPAWVVNLGRIGINLWSIHTVTTDAFTVFVQVAIGLGIMLGGESVIGKLALSSSIAWGLVVWALGEGLGGTFGKGATWLSGTPGGALVYVAAAMVLLLVPSWRWNDGSAARRILTSIGVLWLFVAAIQALPSEGFWHGTHLSRVFANAASNSQPAFLSAPIRAMESAALHDPAVVNAVFVAIFALAGMWLLIRRHSYWALGFTGVALFATWWLGMDFGVIGGTGTDPNIAVPVGLFAAAAWLGLRSAAISPVEERDVREARVDAGYSVESPSVESPYPEVAGAVAGNASGAASTSPWPVRHPVRTWLVGALAVASLWTMLPVLGSLHAAAAVPRGVTLAYVESGGLARVPGSPKAPGFHLVDQYGKPYDLGSFRGKVVLLSFLDPVCYATCPVVAEELAQVAGLLSRRTQNIEFVTIDANPDFRSPSTLRAFDAEHGIAAMKNWQFLTGPRATLEKLYQAYGAPTLTPQVGMVAHSLLVYVIGPDGREQALTQATGTPGIKIEEAYANMFADEASHLVPHA